MSNVVLPTYIACVSGGVDSMVLLHMLKAHEPVVTSALGPEYDIVVAHADHGMRPDSGEDAEIVRTIAEQMGYKYECKHLKLGPNASEQLARDERYKFFEELKNQYKASGIITAHHSGDLVETAIINLIRGTGRRGLTSLGSSASRLRPLLSLSKKDLIEYATKNNITWHEDSTNTDPKYLRNSIRKLLAAKADEKWTQDFQNVLNSIKTTNAQLDKEISQISSYKNRRPFVLSRNWLTKLPFDLSTEFVRASLTTVKANDVDSNLVDRLTLAIKVGKPGLKIDIDKNTLAILTKRSLRYVSRQTLKTRTV
jgi:tRNA(Ile)-lysidine synthase